MSIQQTQMTVNELAVIMQKGFIDTHKKIEDSETRVKKHVDDAIDELAGIVAREFRVIHKEITMLQDDVAILKTDVATLKVDVSELKDSVEHLDHRMDIHEKAVVKDHNIRIRRVERKLQIA